MNSSRLPGKMMLPLAGEHVIIHDIRRAMASSVVDEVVVATTFHPCDDIIARFAERFGACVYRGGEDDVLGRIFNAAEQYNADIVVRLTGDNPFVEPKLISAAVRRVEDGADYASNKIDRTWPIGVDAEAFTFESFEYVESVARGPQHREHVTPYYRQCDDEFEVKNIIAEQVYDGQTLQAGQELRMTLDEFHDYILCRRIYDEVDFTGIIDVRQAIKHILDHNLQLINEKVNQKTL
jgi:spore coat polysaccharide biosynthesis protein SpsF